MIRKTVIAAVACLAATAATVAGAHHSGSMFDDRKEVIYEGTVVQFKWGNPHVFALVDVKGKNGAVQRHTFECPAPSTMMRDGWSRTSLKPGDKVKISANPVRDGRPVAMLLDVTFPDGRMLKQQWTKNIPTRNPNAPGFGNRDPSARLPQPAP